MPGSAPPSPPGPLVAATDLAERLAADDPPVVLDVRWSLARPDGREEYLAGHIPGARYVDLENDLSGPPDPPQGRHPLPRSDALQATLRRLGVRQRAPVVVYDDSGAMAAARAWWVLRWAGHSSVQILDGGLAAWVGAGETLEQGVPPATEEGDVVLHPGALPTVDAETLARRDPDRLLVDSRAPERYSGRHEPVDPVAGHIPGALNLPTTANLDASGRFLPPDALRERFIAAGITPQPEAGPAIVYCGSGVTAAHQLVALELAGLGGVLYPPSWSGWISDPARPVAIGGAE